MRNDFFYKVSDTGSSEEKSESNQVPKRVWTCLVPRRLSLDENLRAKEGGKVTTRGAASSKISVP